MKTNNSFYRVSLALLFLWCFTNNYAQWPQWRGLQRDGISAETNLLKAWTADGPKLLWSVNTVGDGFSSTAIDNGVAVTLGKKDSIEILTALDLNGNVKWQKEVGRASNDKDWPQSRSTPTIYNGKVYSVTVFGDVACVDIKNGNIEWKLPAFEQLNSAGYNGNGIAESPLVFDDKIILTPCGNTTTMVALNRLTGDVIWKSESITDTTSFTSPVLFTMNGKKAIFNSTQVFDFLVDVNTGKIIWKDKTIFGYVPVVNDNQIYYPGSYQKGGALFSWNSEMNQRTIVWEDTVKANVIGGAVLYKNRIYVPGNSRGINCIDLRTGKTLSVYNGINNCTLTVADDMLYAYEDKGGKVCLFQFNGDEIELVSMFKIDQGNGPRIAHMAVANGLLFIRRGNTLMAFNIKNNS